MQVLSINSSNIYGIRKNNNVTFKAAKTNNIKICEPELKHYINVLSSKYKTSAHIQFFLDALGKIRTKNSGKLNIADIGCCDGMLTRTISKYFGRNIKFYGIDLSDDMLNIAREEDKKIGIDSQYQNANAFDMPFEDESMDAMILSSIMHELYSYAAPEYNEQEYSKDSILHFMENAYKKIKKGGVLIIKDPATCEAGYNEKVKFTNINKKDGELPYIQNLSELKKADITKVCSLNKLQRFCMEFKPAQGVIEWDKNDCIMPKWLVTEFLRQRKCIRTPEYWAYEIKERYGTMRPDEMKDFAKKSGFEVVSLENISIANNVNEYAINDDEFTIIDSENKKLTFEDFPMFLQVVLRKPQNTLKF